MGEVSHARSFPPPSRSDGGRACPALVAGGPPKAVEGADLSKSLCLLRRRHDFDGMSSSGIPAFPDVFFEEDILFAVCVLFRISAISCWRSRMLRPLALRARTVGAPPSRRFGARHLPPLLRNGGGKSCVI